MLTGSTLSGHLRTDTAMISTSHFPQKHRNLRKECAEKSRTGSRRQTGCCSVRAEPGIRKIPGIPTTGFQVFFSEMEEDFIEVLKKGITFSLGGVVRKVM